MSLNLAIYLLINGCEIIDAFELEGTLKGHLIQLLYSEQGHLQPDQVFRALSSLALSTETRLLLLGQPIGQPMSVPSHPLKTKPKPSYLHPKSNTSKLNLPSFS